MQLSKRHLSICIGLLFSYESGWHEFQNREHCYKGSFFRRYFLHLCTWFCLSRFSQFILPWKWFSLFCMTVFSNRATLLFACCVCRRVTAVVLPFLLLLSVLTLWGQAQTVPVGNESAESVRRANGVRSKASPAYGTVNQIGNSSLRVKLQQRERESKRGLVCATMS